MDQTQLQAFISSDARLSAEDVALVVNSAQVIELKKGAMLLREGEMCRSLYFVAIGYLRTWYNNDGVVVNLNFTFENQLTSDLKSMLVKVVSDVNIEAGEDATIWILSLDILNKLFSDHLQISLFVRRQAMRILLASEEHSKLFKVYTPTERYRHIEKNNPALLQRISLSQLASYLGMSRETLSRIRGKKE